MAKPKIRPGAKHPTKPGLVMGYNGRYVAKSTYNRQKNNQIRATKTQTKAPTKGGPIVKRQSSAITKAPPSRPTSQRVERVKVRVEPQRKLSGSRSRGALSSGQQRQLPQGKTRPQGRASAKRAQAAAKAARAAQGSTGSATRAAGGSGLPKQTLRLPSAGKTARNLLRNKAVARSAAGKLGGIGLALSGIAEAQSLARSLKRGEGLAALPGMAKRALTAKAPKKAEGPRNKRGRPTQKTTTTARRGMANIPPSEGPVNNPNFGKASKKAAVSSPKPTKATKAATKPAPKPATKPSTKPETKVATKATPKATPKTTTTKTTKTTSSKKRELTAREKMLNRKAERLRKQAAKRTSSARDRFFARKAKTYK